jgi:hypothetical protein
MFSAGPLRVQESTLLEIQQRSSVIRFKGNPQIRLLSLYRRDPH